MNACPTCAQKNPDAANFCLQCGQALVPPSSEVKSGADQGKSPPTQLQLWEMFIGPSKSLQFSLQTGWIWRPAFLYYKDKFSQIETPQGPRFVLSWNWPAALFDSFLWFLYRKMYMFALLYAMAPALAIFLTGDMMVGIVSRVLAGGSANYLYYWHVKDKIRQIMSVPNLDDTVRARFIKEEGGVQLYVIWLGIALHVLMLGVLVAAIVQGPPGDVPSGVLERTPAPKFS